MPLMRLVLKVSRIRGRILTVPHQLPRPLYDADDGTRLAKINGTWGREVPQFNNTRPELYFLSGR